MPSALKKSIRSFSYEGERITNMQTLRTLILISAVAAIGVLIVNILGNVFVMALITAFFIAILIVSFVLVQRGILIVAQVILPTALFLVVLFAVVSDFGLHDASMLAFAVVISLASLTLGQRGALIFSILTIIGVFVIGIAEISGILISETSVLTTWVSVIYTAILIAAFTAMEGILIRLLRQGTEIARTNEQAQAEANRELRELQASLEKRVEQRTAELGESAEQLHKRAEQFEAIAQIARTIGAIQNLEELLPRVTRMVSQRFGFYHVGIFLLDEDREYAVLRAANSPGGQQMLARKHRLEVGHTGIVGYVTSTGNPRIALDTGADAVYFDNPDLPNTRSEMALPLIIGKRIIGALDVQSMEPNAFTQEDLNIMLTLAGQVSSAIQNASLYEESRTALQNTEDAYRQLTGQTWSNIKRITPLVGYRFNGTRPVPLTQPVNDQTTEVQEVAFSVPVQLRSITIGNLRVKAPSHDYEWTEDEITIIQATAERIALAVENARLLLESQKQAAKEQVIGEISTKIGASINLDNILQTTLREMERILPGAEISIQVENE